jgi:hypothetical protein
METMAAAAAAALLLAGIALASKFWANFVLLLYQVDVAPSLCGVDRTTMNEHRFCYLPPCDRVVTSAAVAQHVTACPCLKFLWHGVPAVHVHQPAASFPVLKRCATVCTSNVFLVPLQPFVVTALFVSRLPTIWR